MDSDIFCEILARFKESVRKKRPILWRGGFDGNTDRSLLLHMDNASCHVSAKSLAMIGESGIDMLPHPPYSPDLAPCDFWAFPYAKAKLRGRRFASIEALQAEIRRIFRRTPRETFAQAIYDMAPRWSKCVNAQGAYFEGQDVPYNPEDLPQEADSSESSSSSDEN